MTKFDLIAAQQRDIHLVANVFTAGYVGVKEGVLLSLDRGPDPLRPRDPSMNVGASFIARDRFVDKEKGPLGCIYHASNVPLMAVVYRAVVHTISPDGRKSFSVLRTPTVEKPVASLVKASLVMPKGVKVRAVKGADGNDHLLRVWSGIRTTGTPVLATDGEYLVELKTGEQLTCFFEDGFVRQYEQDTDGLVEVDLAAADMAQLRIEDATLRLVAASPEQWPDPVRREKQLHFILAGMVDLFHLASKDEGVHKDLAQFFFNLPQPQLGLIHRKLAAVLHQRDPILAHAFSVPATASTVLPMKPGIGAAEAAHKRALSDARRAKNRQQRDALSQGMKGSSTGGGSGGKQKKGK